MREAHAAMRHLEQAVTSLQVAGDRLFDPARPVTESNWPKLKTPPDCDSP
jgi:hypothetical protein